MSAELGEKITKRAFFLAYRAAQVVGMGALQARDNATEDEVWGQVCPLKPGTKMAYGDYVFGRMMKLTLRWNDGGQVQSITPMAPKPDYQSWCEKYPEYEDLIAAAAASVEQPVTPGGAG